MNRVLCEWTCSIASLGAAEWVDLEVPFESSCATSQASQGIPIRWPATRRSSTFLESLYDFKKRVTVVVSSQVVQYNGSSSSKKRQFLPSSYTSCTTCSTSGFAARSVLFQQPLSRLSCTHYVTIFLQQKNGMQIGPAGYCLGYGFQIGAKILKNKLKVFDARPECHFFRPASSRIRHRRFIILTFRLLIAL